MTTMVLVLCFFAGAFVFSTSLRRVMEHQLDAPRMNTALAAEHERARTELAGLERVDALLDAWEERRPDRAGEAAAAEERKRIDAAFSSGRAEAERAAEAVRAGLPRKERLRSFARTADVVLVVAGAVLMVVSPVLGVSMVL
ncbi:hypothetical protein [Nocardiopsis tropica]|uniref:Uncharacterized protein n=1 Tax=Nocardiopsis tropica TaxID=109330 RepID=A0ABU7KXR3_9ACTN|nr:hypothetical protein [Nocardiopsis umidischolae]MEE2054065.1 hypothetical protein [Nocardiopsis umidischolae]